MNLKTPFLLVLIALVGCSTPGVDASTGVVATDRETYTISKRSSLYLFFGPPIATRAEVYNEANAFCADRKGKLTTVALQVTDTGFATPGSVTLQFRCE